MPAPLDIVQTVLCGIGVRFVATATLPKFLDERKGTFGRDNVIHTCGYWKRKRKRTITGEKSYMYSRDKEMTPYSTRLGDVARIGLESTTGSSVTSPPSRAPGKSKRAYANYAQDL